jgi:hypothetical protein
LICNLFRVGVIVNLLTKVFGNEAQRHEGSVAKDLAALLVAGVVELDVFVVFEELASPEFGSSCLPFFQIKPPVSSITISPPPHVLDVDLPKNYV